MTICNFVFIILRDAKVAHSIVANVVLILTLAYMIFQQSILLQADLEIYSTVITLGWCAVIERFLKAANEIIVVRFVMLPFVLTAERHIVEEIASRSPSSLLIMKENAYVLKNAALHAVQSLVENGLNVITPIILLVSRTAALSVSLDYIQLVIVESGLAFVFLAGSSILAYDHKKKQRLSKKDTEIEEQARSLMTSIATLIINGSGKILPTWMINLKKEASGPATKHGMIMAFLYGFLEIASTGIPILLVWFIKRKQHFLPLYIIIQPMFWNSWYLFWTVKSLVVSTAPWSQYAEFMTNSDPAPSGLKHPHSAKEMMSAFDDPTLNEIELAGPSGCGKTTLMKRIIAEICTKFMLGYVIYVDQFACLPSGLLIYEYYASAFPEGVIPENFETELLNRSERLGIANIINADTIKKPFSNPSGGEKKRIIFLKYVLPILMNSSKVMIAFFDEVSAGLDSHSFANVRVLIEDVKNMGVKVVSIDHHEHDGDKIKRVAVFKKVVKGFHMSSPTIISIWQRMLIKLFPYRYREEPPHPQQELELGEGLTDIKVWCPEIGLEES